MRGVQDRVSRSRRIDEAQLVTAKDGVQRRARRGWHVMHGIWTPALAGVGADPAPDIPLLPRRREH